MIDDILKSQIAKSETIKMMIDDDMLRKEIARLREALRPFGEYAQQQMKVYSWQHHDDSAFYGVKRPGAKQITYGDFRRAAAVIAGSDDI